MDIDNTPPPPSPDILISPSLMSISADVAADGLLLYIAEASYEPGTSPLSSWIPITGYNEEKGMGTPVLGRPVEGPLDLFQR